MSDRYLQVHDQLIRFQRKRRFIALSGGVPADQAGESLNFHEQTILLTLFAEPDRSVKELIEVLGLEQSWVSRIVSSLEKRKLVKATPSDRDGRVKLLSITSQGQKVLESLDVILSAVMQQALSELGPSDQKELIGFFEALADGIDAPAYPKRRDSHPADVALSRITSGTGILSDSVFGSGLNNTQIQIFYILDESRDAAVPISAINEQVPFDMSTVSRTISSFQKRGWVKKERSKEDKRSYLIRITPKGEEQLSHYRACASSFFQKPVSSLDQNLVSRALGFLEQLTGEEEALPAPAVEYRKELFSAEQLQKLALPGDIGIKSGHSYLVLFRNDRPAILAELGGVEIDSPVQQVHFLDKNISREQSLRILQNLLGEP